MLNFQQETVATDFGFLMTPQNVEEHLADFRMRKKIILTEEAGSRGQGAGGNKKGTSP